mmetsp:Transcript_49364/g.114105  ORF Transcript_49364/g.114105 Transcript_49364/m.114105 type:complete len:401 (-) Transcript_49364:353-1555(-)
MSQPRSGRVLATSWPRPGPIHVPAETWSSHLEQRLKLLGVRVLRNLLYEALPREVDLDLLHPLELVVARDHVDGCSRPAKAAGPAHAVQVRLGIALPALLHRHVELHDEGDRLDVHAAREHVGGHEEARGAAAEVGDDLVARGLFHPTVQHRDVVAHLHQLLTHSLDRVASVREDDALPDRHHIEHVDELLLLLCLALGAVEHLPHLVVEDVVALHLNLRPISARDGRHLLGELLDGIGPRGREEERLHALGQPLSDALRGVAQPAEQKHLVRLVKHENLQLAGVEHTHVDQRPHLSRRADHDLLIQGRAALVPLLAQDGLHADARGLEQVPAHFEDLLGDLLREFPRRAETQRLRPQFGAASQLCGHDRLEHAKNKAGGLAGAVVRLGEQVALAPDLWE